MFLGRRRYNSLVQCIYCLLPNMILHGRENDVGRRQTLLIAPAIIRGTSTRMGLPFATVDSNSNMLDQRRMCYQQQ